MCLAQRVANYAVAESYCKVETAHDRVRPQLKGGTDSTIALPPQNQRFCLANVSRLPGTWKDTIAITVSTNVLVCERCVDR